MDQFYKNGKRLHSYCKRCHSDAQREVQRLYKQSAKYNASKHGYQRKYNKTAKGYAARMRRKLAKLDLPHEPYDPFDIYDRDGGTCSLCGEPCEKYKPNGHRAFQIEHVVPLQVDIMLLPLFGITEHPGDVKCNVTIAHDSCNSSKGNRMTQADADNYFRLRELYKE